jgi:hypothetical protein
MAIVLAVAVLLALIVIVGLVLAFPVMLLWNGCLVGAIAGVNEISWLQAWGILVLFGLLFKSGDTSVSKKA